MIKKLKGILCISPLISLIILACYYIQGFLGGVIIASSIPLFVYGLAVLLEKE